MATNKNQHFVPRCYLRPFTIHGSAAAINVFNLDRGRFIENAPVKNQCSRDYFYGADLKLERALQGMERLYAESLTQILAPAYRLRDDHRQVLRRFWLLQHMRTEAASRRAVEMSDRMFAAAGVPASKYKLGIKEAVQNAMRAFVEHKDAVDDLKICLFRNSSNVPFVTSDDPAVLTNRWYLQSSRARGQSAGLNSAGALLLLPISPDVLCVGYDGDLYSVPNRDGWVTVRNDTDVASINEHQYYNCAANVFVQDAADADAVRAAYARVASNRPSRRMKLHYAVLDRVESGKKVYRVVNPDDAPDHSEAVIHTEAVQPRPTAWPVQILWHPRPTVYTNGTAVGYIRAAWCSEFGGTFQRLRV